MEDSLSIIFAVIVSLLLMFLFPLVDTWEMQDNLSYVVVYSTVVDFVDTARNVGFVSDDSYSSFVSRIEATGNTYDVTLEHKQFIPDVSGYVNHYTSEILAGTADDKKYYFNKYDYFYVTVKNTNRTQATLLSDFITGGSDSNFKIGVAYGGVVWSVRDHE
jgi:hypothetical protein